MIVKEGVGRRQLSLSLGISRFWWRTRRLGMLLQSGPKRNLRTDRVVSAKGRAEDAAGGLHVLTVTPFYPFEGDDANGCFVAEPIDALGKLGIRNTVIAVQPFYRSRRASVSSYPCEWCQYFSLPGGAGLPVAGAFLFARIVGRVRELLRTEPIDLIHAHGPLPCGHAAMLLSRELGLRYVVSVHGLDAFSTAQVSGRAGEWCRRVSRRIYAGSRRVICISEHVREAVLEGLGRNCRTSVVYNGVDVERFTPALESTPSLLTILSVGNLIPTKGHEYLIRALAALVPEFPALELQIIGEGALRERLQSCTEKLGVAGRVHFCGRQSRAQVVDAMRRCTVFALPSSYEGLGCVYLEAMACAKPAIGCRGQGIAEVIQQGKNGFLVGPENEEELALAFAMLLREPERRRNVGATARETILDGFMLQQQAENLERIYRESVA